MGRSYLGIDLSGKQVEANREKWLELEDLESPYSVVAPVWIESDAVKHLKSLDSESRDFCFSCPPYFGLERYSDSPEDLSNLSDEDFSAQIEETLAELFRVLREDRFACFVVGDSLANDRSVRDLKHLFQSAGEKAGFKHFTSFVFTHFTSPVLTPRWGKAGGHRGRAVRNVEDLIVFVKGDITAAQHRLLDLAEESPKLKQLEENVLKRVQLQAQV